MIRFRHDKIMCTLVSMRATAHKHLQHVQDIRARNLSYKQIIFEFNLISIPTFLNFSISSPYFYFIQFYFQIQKCYPLKYIDLFKDIQFFIKQILKLTVVTIFCLNYGCIIYCLFYFASKQSILA